MDFLHWQEKTFIVTIFAAYLLNFCTKFSQKPIVDFHENSGEEVKYSFCPFFQIVAIQSTEFVALLCSHIRPIVSSF